MFDVQDLTEELIKASDETDIALAELKKQREAAESQLGSMNQVRPSPPSIPPHNCSVSPYPILVTILGPATPSLHHLPQPLPATPVPLAGKPHTGRARVAGQSL